MYDLLLEQMATLELEHPNSLDTFPADSIFWSKDRLEELLLAYPANDRKFLSDHKQRFLILRSTLQSLFQGRSLRLDMKNYYQMLVTKLDDIAQFIQNREVINSNHETDSVEDLYSSLKPSVDSGKLDLLLSKLEQQTATISSIDDTLQAWSDGSGFSLEDESLEPVLEVSHCSPAKAP